ncbi:AAA family ATPase [Micromonospora taraxaci]|uniref:AAA family ATPase n=1 Tax=Micromonospora taraxaci TaxID=1316803 RepID=UPI0033CF77B2
MSDRLRQDLNWVTNQLLRGVDHSSSSNAKYRDLEKYLAELSQTDPRAVYATYISKAGNAVVRFDQSDRARNARLLVGLLDPPPSESPERTMDTLLRYCSERRPETEILTLLRERSLPEDRSGQASDPPWSLHGGIYGIPNTRSFLLRLFDEEDDLDVREFRRETERFDGPIRFRVDDGKVFRASFPSAVLYRDRWDDEGFKTLFSLVLHVDPYTEVEIGEVKILHKRQSGGPTLMPEGYFDGLGPQYGSLGQTYSYYENLRQLPKKTYLKLLKGLRDMAYDPSVRRSFEDEEGFDRSLLRSGGAARALETARALFVRSPNRQQLRGMNFTFNTSVGGESFSVDFAFNQSAHLPDRINAIIGYNGTGKTQLLANIALVATGDMQQRALFNAYGEIAQSESVRFSKVVAVSYSAFDTFILPDAFWRRDEAELVQKRLQEKGEAWGYVYCGLRKRAKGQPRASRELKGLKGIDEIVEDFGRALDLARAGDNRTTFLDALEVISKEPSFGSASLVPYTVPVGTAWEEHFRRLSTGHKIVLNILVHVAGHCEPGSLVLIDEPESHLHPSLLAALIRALNMTLQRTDSYAILATHSPVVLQEVPRRYVQILHRYGKETSISRPSSETFGENVGYLTSNVFHLDSTKTDYHFVLERLAQEMSLEQVEELFDDEMSLQARAYLLGLMDGDED